MPGIPFLYLLDLQSNALILTLEPSNQTPKYYRRHQFAPGRRQVIPNLSTPRHQKTEHPNVRSVRFNVPFGKN
jgi:hypothetical protein